MLLVNTFSDYELHVMHVNILIYYYEAMKPACVIIILEWEEVYM